MVIPYSISAFLIILSLSLVAQPDDIKLDSSDVPTTSEIVSTSSPVIHPGPIDISELIDSTRQEEFQSDLSSIQGSLKDYKYSDAIDLMQALITKLTFERQLHIETFFPADFNNLKPMSGEQLSVGSELSDNQYGVVFQRVYQGDTAESIQVNVVYSDVSVKEYTNLIKNPLLVSELDNLELIKVNDKYSALEKVSDGESYIEQNILVKDNLMINITSNGMASNVISDFFNLIDVSNLIHYLQ